MPLSEDISNSPYKELTFAVNELVYKDALAFFQGNEEVLHANIHGAMLSKIDMFATAHRTGIGKFSSLLEGVDITL